MNTTPTGKQDFPSAPEPSPQDETQTVAAGGITMERGGDTFEHTPGTWYPVRYVNDDGHEFIEVKIGKSRYAQAVAYVGSGCPEYFRGDRMANARMLAASPKLFQALVMMMEDLDGLMRESQGVAGLHLNGEVAPWSDLDESGQFERFSGRYFARHAIAEATGKEPA